jgi:hypothetical protein
LLQEIVNSSFLGTDADVHCNENPIYVFLFWELRGLSPNFHIHVSVSDLYSPRIGLHISSSRIGRLIVGIYKSLTDTRVCKLGPRYSFSGNICSEFFFGILSLPCSIRDLYANREVSWLKGRWQDVSFKTYSFWFVPELTNF